MTALERALTLAEPEGYVRLFVDEGERMRMLIADLRWVIAARVPNESRLLTYTDRLLSAFPHTEAHGVPAAIRKPQSTINNLVEPLSDRELEVLRLIAEGLSNREIADRLVVVVGTVKWYINNIYTKLGIHSRTQALARARELDLL
jgi:LuxR family maltose regulon positive regulatory protein